MATDRPALTRGDLERIARALFEYQESVLPEGETWDELDEGDRSLWINSVTVVLQQLDKLA